MKQITLPIILMLCLHAVTAQTTYTFNGNGNWSNAGNWLNSLPPPTPISSNSIINIDPAGDGVCIVDIPVTLPVTVTLNVLPGRQLIVMGNLTVLSGNSNPTKLVKELMLFSNGSGGYDTSGAIIYSYDNLNRLIQAIDCNFGTNTGDTTDYRYYSYFYHGNDTLPYQRTLTYQPAYNSGISFFTYYADGRLDYDSSVYYTYPPFIPGSSAEVRKFIYSGDSSTLLSKRYSNGILTATASGKSFRSALNGNLFYKKDSATGSITEITISHLAGINPFYSAMRCGRRGVLESQYKQWEWQDAPKNLISNWRQVNTSGTNIQQDMDTVSYVLRNDGYPMEANVTSTNIYNNYPPSTEVFKIVYVYE